MNKDIFSSTTELCEEYIIRRNKAEGIKGERDSYKLGSKEWHTLVESVRQELGRIREQKSNLLGRKEVFMAWKKRIEVGCHKPVNKGNPSGWLCGDKIGTPETFYFCEDCKKEVSPIDKAIKEINEVLK